MSIKKRSRDGNYRPGDIIHIPYLWVEEFHYSRRKGLTRYRKILKNHYYVVVSTCEKKGKFPHNMELAAMRSLNNRKVFNDQIVIEKGVMRKDTIVNTNVIIYADREDIHLRGSYIHGSLDERTLSSVRMAACGRNVKFSYINLRAGRFRPVLYYRTGRKPDGKGWLQACFIEDENVFMQGVKTENGTAASTPEEAAGILGERLGMKLAYRKVWNSWKHEYAKYLYAASEEDDMHSIFFRGGLPEGCAANWLCHIHF